jgi:hypothetical protein
MVLQSLNSIDSPNPLGCNCGIRALKEVQTLSHTMHLATNCWTLCAFHATNTNLAINYGCIIPENALDPHRHVTLILSIDWVRNSLHSTVLPYLEQMVIFPLEPFGSL